MNNEDFGFETLELWKKVRVFKTEMSALSKGFPPEEKFRLSDQLTRSARSINSLICEGHGRFSYPDQIHYCIQARGSLLETINHLFDAIDEKYISFETLQQSKAKAKEIERILNGYIIHLRQKRDSLKKGATNAKPL